MSGIRLVYNDLLSEKEEIENAAKLHWLHWLVILGSLILTFGAWYLTKSQVQEKIEVQFIREADQVVDLVYERLSKYEDALWSGVAAIHSQSHGIHYDEWKRFSDTLNIDKKYPGINGIGVIFYAPDEASKEGFLQRERETRPDFNIHPPHDKGEYWPITFIEPIESNRKALGLDMAHEENRYQAALKAKVSGEAQITGPITLVQDSEKTPGFLFYAPFYKDRQYESADKRQQNFIGMVYAPFIFKKLMQGTLEKAKRRVGIEIRDEERILYNEHLPTYTDYDPDPIFKKQYELHAYGRTWMFDIWTTKSFNDSIHDNEPLVILIGGILIDSMLLAFFIFMTRSNKRAIKFAGKMTDSYKAKNEELAELIEKLTDSNQELERFAYVAAHDMQEPLRMTANFSELLEKEHLEQLDEQGQEFLKHCREGSLRLHQILEDLMEYSRVENEDYNKERVNANLILETVLQNLEVAITDKKAEIESSQLPEIICNPVRFSRLLQNLIANGIKYQKDGDIPRIHIDAKKQDDNWLFSVTDNGIGIKEKYQEQIFEPFKRLHTAGEYPGTGIGLAICAKIVEKMNGKLWVESEENKGSTFYFTIPQ